MDIKSVLDERVIDLNMTAKNKKEAIEHLAGKLKDAGYIADVDSYIDDIYLRESLVLCQDLVQVKMRFSSS